MPTPCAASKRDADEEKKSKIPNWVVYIIVIAIIVLWFYLLFSGILIGWLQMIPPAPSNIDFDQISNYIYIGIFIFVIVVIIIVYVWVYGDRVRWHSTAPHWRVDGKKKEA